MGFLIKLLAPQIVGFVFKLIMEQLDKRITDDRSKVSRELYEIVDREKVQIYNDAMEAAKKSGIYKKLKGMM